MRSGGKERERESTPESQPTLDCLRCPLRGSHGGVNRPQQREAESTMGWSGARKG